MMDPNQETPNPFESPRTLPGEALPGEDPTRPFFSQQGPTGPEDYESLPALRKGGLCSGIIIAHVILMVFGGCIPFGRLLSLVTLLGVIAVCVSVLTGNIYHNKKLPDGSLEPWGTANKVAAIIILVLLAAGTLGLVYAFYAPAIR